MKENASQYVEMQEKEDAAQQEYEYVDVQSGQTDQEPEAENRITCVVVDEERILRPTGEALLRNSAI